MEQILEKLKIDVNFRERRNKNLGIAVLLKEKYHLDIELSRLKAVIEDANSMDRYWRLHTRNYPDLRGKDYGDKKEYTQKVQLNLGYESGYNQLSRPHKS